MHSIYTTTGFIIDSRPYGEAGKVLSLFTRDFGLVRAVAQGIRLEKSKLRYFAQNHSLGIYSLVCGKEFWRLTSAQEKPSETSAGGAGLAKNELVARIALLLKRFLHGEESHAGLFVCVESLLNFVSDNPGLNRDERETLESLSVLRILRNLGYVGDDDKLSEFADSEIIDRKLLKDAYPMRVAMNRHINKALKESQL